MSSSPGFTTFWVASTVSDFGSAITALAVQVLVVVDLDGSAAQVGLVNAARWLPYLLFGVVAGVLVDRARRRPLLVGTDLGCGVLLLAIPLLALTGRLQISALVVVMALFGLLALVHDAAFQSFVPRLVPRHLLTPAHARLDQSDAVAQASGPALAGGLVSLVGALLAILVDAVSFLFSGLRMRRVPVTEPPPRPVSLRGVGGEAVEGLRWVYGHRLLRPFALGSHTWFVFNAAAGAVLVPYAVRTLHLSAFGLGLGLAVAGMGALLGSLAAVRLGARLGVGRVVVGCWLCTALGWALVALAADSWAGWAVFGLGQLVLGLGLGAENSNSMGYRQAVTPDRLQARMNVTMRSINRAAVVVGAPVGGWLGDRFGYRPVLWVAVAGFVLTAGALARSPYVSARLGDRYARSD